MIRTIGGIQAAFAADEGDRQVSLHRPAHDCAGIGIEARGNINRHNRAAQVVDEIDRCAECTGRFAVKTGTQQRIEHQVVITGQVQRPATAAPPASNQRDAAVAASPFNSAGSFSAQTVTSSPFSRASRATM